MRQRLILFDLLLFLLAEGSLMNSGSAETWKPAGRFTEVLLNEIFLLWETVALRAYRGTRYEHCS